MHPPAPHDTFPAMLAKYAVAYLATGIAFAAIDVVWLGWAASNLYRPVIGSLLADRPRMGPAVAFYLLYIAGILHFAVIPALRSGDWTAALVNGAILGLIAYGTYDLTSQAVLKVWSTKITLLDILWGTFLTGSAATAGFFATTALFGRS